MNAPIFNPEHIFMLLMHCFVCSSLAGYGDCADTLPSSPEREAHVMTNAVRMDPAGFRDLYIKEKGILLPENYPPVAPLWYNAELGRAARFHSADMAANCGMAHNSCDGTAWSTRVISFYKASRTLGENVATGRSSGLETVIQWLRDDFNRVPAPDSSLGDGANSPTDGHRRNIMNPSFHELGCGYGYSASRRYNHFWTQDFGGGSLKDKYKVPAGCHFSPNASTLAYAANFYDAAGLAPKSAVVFIDEISYAMTLHLGSAGKGTWIYSISKDAKTHCYYFKFVDDSGDTIRFPQTSRLTTGTDLCCEGNGTINRLSRPKTEAAGMDRSIMRNSAQYRLDGVKIGGKLLQYRASGISVYGNRRDVRLQRR